MNANRLAKEKELNEMIEHESSDDENTQIIIDTLKTELEQIYLLEADGAIIRSRAKWHEQGEKSSSYFFHLEKQHSLKKKNIKKLIVNNKIINQNEILNSIMQFYEKLYDDPKIDVTKDHGFFTQENIPKLEMIDKERCEGLITIQECETIIPKFKKNKTPGNDGIPVEFYLVFWSEVKNILVDSYNYSFENGSLSNSQRQAIISLINKPGKDRMYIENWRPISLLNVDYKIMTKCLTERLVKVIDTLVHKLQFGFIKGRNINDALRVMLDIVDDTDLQKKEGLLLAIDFQKAFDSLSWEYLFRVLELYNFGE